MWMGWIVHKKCCGKTSNVTNWINDSGRHSDQNRGNPEKGNEVTKLKNRNH